MGTRSLTFVYDDGDFKEPIINMYRQFDGYPEGHGLQLAEFLSSGRIVNGISGMGKELQFNGMGCLAAQLVATFKEGAGNFYMVSVNAKDCGQDYEYHIGLKDGQFIIRVVDRGMNFFGVSHSETNDVMFEGNLNQFFRFCKSAQEVDFELTENSVDQLKQDLHGGMVEVVFTKNDGSERVMKCTLKEDLVPQVEVKGTKRYNPDVLAVWDTEASGWRSFRWDSIKTVRVL